MFTTTKNARITERSCGGWIAIFDDGCLRLGVTADTREAANEHLEEAIARWKAAFSLQPSAASGLGHGSDGFRA